MHPLPEVNDVNWGEFEVQNLTTMMLSPDSRLLSRCLLCGKIVPLRGRWLSHRQQFTISFKFWHSALTTFTGCQIQEEHDIETFSKETSLSIFSHLLGWVLIEYYSTKWIMLFSYNMYKIFIVFFRSGAVSSLLSKILSRCFAQEFPPEIDWRLLTGSAVAYQEACMPSNITFLHWKLQKKVSARRYLINF